MIQTCPTETVLRQFNDGRINDLLVIDQIVEHLGLCEACIDKLESMGPCPIVAGLRHSASNELMANDTDIQEQDLDLESIRESLDDLKSRFRSSVSDQLVDPARFGENRYELIASVGEGEFGCVYGALAEPRFSSVDSAELVAIKIPHAHKLTSHRHFQQFFHDAQKATDLQHSGIQSVLDFGYWDEKRLFLAKSMIQHPTLTKIARKNSTRLNHDSMWSIFQQLVDAIHYAHQQKVIHRHLNPDNIHLIISEPSETSKKSPSPREIHVVVSDFGFVLDSRYHFDLVETSNAKTPFVSPESATLKADYIDQRTDIYALGKILKLLCRLTNDPRDEERIQKIIDKSTFVRRRDRYQSVSELQSALDLI